MTEKTGGARELPNNIEAEQALLGAILVNNAAYDRVRQFLRPEHFYEPLHQRIFFIISEMIEVGALVTPILIKHYLPKDAKVGSMTLAHYLIRLATEAVTIINARDYGQAIHDMWRYRQAAIAAEDFLAILYDLPPGYDPIGVSTKFEETLAQTRADKVSAERRRGHGQQYLAHLDAARETGRAAGVPLFMSEIGRIIAEPTLIAGNLYGIVASSGEGKTSFVMQQVIHALRQGHPVQIHSYDQSADQMIAQMIAQLHTIEAQRQAMLQFNEAEHEKIVDFALWIDQQPFEIIKCKDQTAAQLVAMATSFTKRYAKDKTPLIVTDHIQAVRPDATQQRRQKEPDEGTKVKEINLVIKAGAASADAAWVMLNQRNTTGTDRPNPRPIPRDVHGGEAALYSYDTMLYLYRAKKFFEVRKRVASSEADWKIINKVFASAVREGQDIVELGALKVRFGNVFQEPALLDFEARYTRYVDKQAAAADQEEMAALFTARI